MASAYPPRAAIVILTIPCMSDGELVEAFEDPGYRKFRYEIAMTISHRIKGGADPARFRNVKAGAMKDAIERVSHV